MTEGQEVVSRLARRQNVAICRALRDRPASEILMRDERVTGWKAGGRLRQKRQRKMPLCRMFSTGATGLEPATSGVTGRHRSTGYDPESPARAGISSPCEPAVTGYDRLPPGRACVLRV